MRTFLDPSLLRLLTHQIFLSIKHLRSVASICKFRVSCRSNNRSFISTPDKKRTEQQPPAARHRQSQCNAINMLTSYAITDQDYVRTLERCPNQKIAFFFPIVSYSNQQQQHNDHEDKHPTTTQHMHSIRLCAI